MSHRYHKVQSLTFDLHLQLWLRFRFSFSGTHTIIHSPLESCWTPPSSSHSCPHWHPVFFCWAFSLLTLPPTQCILSLTWTASVIWAWSARACIIQCSVLLSLLTRHSVNVLLGFSHFLISVGLFFLSKPLPELVSAYRTLLFIFVYVS